MVLLIAIIVALIAHVLLGWQWSVIGGIVAGLAQRRFGWLSGLFAVAFGWLILVVYNLAVAPAETARFIEITARLFGNMPGPMLVLTTILLGAVLGLLGGTAGSLVRSIVDLFRSPGPTTRKRPAEKPDSSESAVDEISALAASVETLGTEHENPI